MQSSSSKRKQAYPQFMPRKRSFIIRYKLILQLKKLITENPFFGTREGNKTKKETCISTS